MTQVLQQLRVGLDQAGFEQRRQLVELLIDRVVVPIRSRRGRGRRLGRR
jgi:hypothetical protein